MYCRTIMVCFLFMLSGVPGALSGTANDLAVEQLQWLYSKSAEQSFKKDRDAGNIRFYAVYGYARSIPGIGELNYARCYKDVVELNVIEGTSDNILSEEHGSLIGLANDFALEYNYLMKQHIDHTDKGDCSPRTDWDAMLSVVTGQVWGKNQTEGIVGINIIGSPVLTIDLNDLSRTDEILKDTCVALVDHGIDEIVTVEVYEWLHTSPGYNHRKFKVFRCSSGQILSD